MDEEDAAADPYLPYDGGGDTIPLQEISKRGMPNPAIYFFSLLPWKRRTIYGVDTNTISSVQALNANVD